MVCGIEIFFHKVRYFVVCGYVIVDRASFIDAKIDIRHPFL